MRSAVLSAWRTLRDACKVLVVVNSRRTKPVVDRSIRLTMVQFGDYADAFFRFRDGGAETYYAQKYSVDFVSELAGANGVEALTVLSIGADAPAQVLPNGIRTSGLELYPRGSPPRDRQLIEAVRATMPTHLIVMSPCISLIAWAVENQVPVLPMFADSFLSGKLMARLRARLLVMLLNSSSIDLVANHNLAASLELKRIGVRAEKIVPFDWPAVLSPQGYAAKKAPPADRPFRIVYVGSVIEDKGVGDLIEAVSKLQKRGRAVQLSIIGKGELSKFRDLANSLNAQDQVQFLGIKSHSEVVAAMRDNDAVVVPSRWAYPEGLPMTLYEALCVRTPLITSNHPMFSLRIRDMENALVFPERDSDALADGIEKLIGSQSIYETLSERSADAAENYLCPLKYDRLISDFLSSEKRTDLRRYSLEKQLPR